jgi:carbon monoxide dehydrogenase subunit G
MTMTGEISGEGEGGTLLSYHVDAQIGGKLAQLGQRLINGSAKKMADEFFANFARIL